LLDAFLQGLLGYGPGSGPAGVGGVCTVGVVCSPAVVVDDGRARAGVVVGLATRTGGRAGTDAGGGGKLWTVTDAGGAAAVRMTGRARTGSRS
jgi:hypothetical protein